MEISTRDIYNYIHSTNASISLFVGQNEVLEKGNNDLNCCMTDCRFLDNSDNPNNDNFIASISLTFVVIVFGCFFFLKTQAVKQLFMHYPKEVQ